MISLLLPSRKRPESFTRMVQSVNKTARSYVEIVARFDDDDSESAEVVRSLGVIVVVGPRIRAITQCWNEAFAEATGDIVCQANDDIVFTTSGWDDMVEQAFEEVPDRILMVHGNDVFGHGDKFGPHPFVSRKWVECLGYFIPPYYVSDFGDAHVNELADRIGRRRYVPFDIEHRHFSYGFTDMNDDTTKERLARHVADDPDSLYYSAEKAQERVDDAKKLALLMDPRIDTSGWAPAKGRNGVLSAGKCIHCGSIMTVAVHEGRFIHCNECGYQRERVQQ